MNEIKKTKENFTTNEAAKYLRTSPVTLWRLRKNGLISFRRVASKIIYTREDLETFLERNKNEAITA